MTTPPMNIELRKRLREIEEEIVSRAPEHDIDPTLVRVANLLEVLGDPQRAYPVIHITGTNGKTSTARMIERLLSELNLRTGRFTSPHLHDIRERIVLSGEPVSPERLIEAYDDLAPLLALVEERSLEAATGRLSFFEVLVALAYAIFADAPVDVAVVEVGLGGTWDATNVADGAVAVVMPIAVDHERYLGAEVELIAGEKSGIIKPDAIAISAPQEPVAVEVLRERAAEVGVPIVFDIGSSGDDFSDGGSDDAHESAVPAIGSGGIAVLARDVAVGGQMLTLRGLAGDYPTSSCRCTVSTRRTTRSSRSRPSRRLSGEGSSRSTSTSCAPRSPRSPRRGGSRSSAAARRSSSTRHTIRPGSPRSSRRSRTPSSSPG